ncbi:hypothetical protein GGR54DRAFT_268425 [Hypoxylon sp. NC1633]|nr:hypothetical protein GGR54DRAFT_268425 [Hypoxylon sp. NC1633]
MMITMTMAMFVLPALLGFADAPDPVCSALDAEARDVLAKIEENVRPILPTWTLIAIVIFGIINWFPPRLAAAWDWASTKAADYQGNSDHVRRIISCVQFVDSAMSPFRFGPSPTDLARRLDNAERALARTEERRAATEQDRDAQVNAARADLARAILHLNEVHDFADKLEEGWANTIRAVKLRLGRPTPGTL